MSSPSLKVIPTLEDFMAGAVAAGVASFQKQSPAREAMEQLGSGLVADNIANYSQFSDNMTSNALSVPIEEGDMLTGAVRAGYSMYNGRSNKAVLMDGVKGVLCRLVGRELAKKFFGGASAPAPTV